MRWGWLGTFGGSLIAHGAVAALFLVTPGSAVPPPPPVDPAPALAGETFELPAPESVSLPLANASPSPDTQAAAAPIEFPDAPARPTPPARAKVSSRPSHQGRPSGGHTKSRAPDGDTGATGPAALFGAVGDRSAADLTRAITRGFPQAASGDPVWRSVPFGAAGEATLVLTLDDSGHIASVQVVGSPSRALAQGIQRTLSLIKGRPFTARGKVTRLHLSAKVIPNTIPDGLHGDVFAIGAGGDEGFFALSIGRRIELRVHAK